MTEEADIPPAGDPPGCLPAALAMAASSVQVAAGIAITQQFSGLFIPIWIVTLAVVAVLGTVGYIFLIDRMTLQNVLMTGLFTGALVPFIDFWISYRGVLDVAALAVVMAYGLAGSGAAVLAWGLLIWQLRSDRAWLSIAYASIFEVLVFRSVL